MSKYRDERAELNLTLTVKKYGSAKDEQTLCALINDRDSCRNVLKEICDIVYNPKPDNDGHRRNKINELQKFLTDRGAFALYGEAAPDFHRGMSKLIEAATTSFNTSMKLLDQMGVDLSNMQQLAKRIP